jgi:hypothetical protein
MAQDPTSIANRALGRIGAHSIMDIEDDASEGDRNAILSLQWLEACVREIGRDHEWNCLTDFEELGRLNVDPPYNFKWDYGFVLPENFLRLNRFNGYETAEVQDCYQVVNQRHILSDADVAQVEFNRYTLDTTQYDPMFTEAVVVLLASKLSVPIRQDEELMMALRREYETIALPKARMQDGNERKQRPWSPTKESRWNSARKFSTVRSHPN